MVTSSLNLIQWPGNQAHNCEMVYYKIRLIYQDVYTLHQPHGVATTVRMRKPISPGQVSDNHGQLFRPCLASPAWHKLQGHILNAIITNIRFSKIVVCYPVTRAFVFLTHTAATIIDPLLQRIQSVMPPIKVSRPKLSTPVPQFRFHPRNQYFCMSRIPKATTS